MRWQPQTSTPTVIEAIGRDDHMLAEEIGASSRRVRVRVAAPSAVLLTR